MVFMQIRALVEDITSVMEAFQSSSDHNPHKTDSGEGMLQQTDIDSVSEDSSHNHPSEQQLLYIPYS